TLLMVSRPLPTAAPCSRCGFVPSPKAAKPIARRLNCWPARWACPRRAYGLSRERPRASSRWPSMAIRKGSGKRCARLFRRTNDGIDMTARIIDGKRIAAELRARVADEAGRARRDHGLTPGLAVVLVGEDPASQVYVRSKHRLTQEAGMASFEHVLPADVAQDELLALIARLNRDPLVHGILVQLPLPKSLNTEAVINAIDPAKDVDGLHPNNAGRLANGFAALSPCTPLGCIILTKSVHASLQGMNAIVIGRSNLVGRP